MYFFKIDTVKSDCPVQSFRKKKFQEILKKKRSTGHFQFFFFFCSPPKSEKNFL